MYQVELSSDLFLIQVGVVFCTDNSSSSGSQSGSADGNHLAFLP